MADETEVATEVVVAGFDIVTLGSVLSAGFNTPGLRLGSDFALDEGALFAAFGLLEGMSSSELASLMMEWQKSFIASATVEKKMLADMAATGRVSSSTGADKPYEVVDGIAQIPLAGLMTKHPTCMSEMFGGGSSTSRVRGMLRSADRDPDVISKAVIGDSPGGEVAGSFDLAYDIANGHKPTDYYAEDMTASAAMIAASGARSIYTNLNGILGSLGVYAKLVDTAKEDESRGRKVHVVKAGRLKATGEPGQFSPDQMAAVQARVDSLHGLALRTVRNGRPGMTKAQLLEVADAGIFIGRQAVGIGLADGVMTRDEAHARSLENNRRDKSERKTNMAVSIPQLNAWLDNDTGAEPQVPAQVAPQPAATATPAPTGQGAGQTQATDPQLSQALASMGISNASDLRELATMASIGNKSIATDRERVKKLAAATIRTNDAAMAAAEALQIVAAEKIIDTASYEVVQMLGASYESTIQARKGTTRPGRLSASSNNGTVPANVTPAAPSDAEATEDEVVTGMVEGIISSNYAPPVNSTGGRKVA